MKKLVKRKIKKMITNKEKERVQKEEDTKYMSINVYEEKTNEQPVGLEPKRLEEDKPETEDEEKEALRLLITKKHKIQDDEEDYDIILNTTRYIEEIVIGWIDRKLIDRVYDTTVKGKYQEVITDLENYNLWLSEPKVTGTKTIRVEIFFTVQTEYIL